MMIHAALSRTRSEVPADVAADRVLADAPHRIGAVTLVVRDLEKISEFYQVALGLSPIEKERDSVRLGVGNSILLELKQDRQARLATRREAGLFHIAFLLPRQSELGAWLAFASEQGLPLLGASDHLVSEALYLADPEGNGIEIYVDRPSSEWHRVNGMIEMASEPLNLQNLVSAAAGRNWNGFPAEGLIGHVHLQVGDIAAADAFYEKLLGFEITCRYPGASFFGSGGYHHQLAANVWNSRGAPARSEHTTGLASVEILASGHVLEALRSKSPTRSFEVATDSSVSLRDPWGTLITLRASDSGVA